MDTQAIYGRETNMHTGHLHTGNPPSLASRTHPLRNIPGRCQACKTVFWQRTMDTGEYLRVHECKRPLISARQHSPKSHGLAQPCALVPQQSVSLLHRVPVLHLLVVEFSLDSQHVPQHRQAPPQEGNVMDMRMGGGGRDGGRGKWIQVLGIEQGGRYLGRIV